MAYSEVPINWLIDWKFIPQSGNMFPSEIIYLLSTVNAKQNQMYL